MLNFCSANAKYSFFEKGKAMFEISTPLLDANCETFVPTRFQSKLSCFSENCVSNCVMETFNAFEASSIYCSLLTTLGIAIFRLPISV